MDIFGSMFFNHKAAMLKTDSERALWHEFELKAPFKAGVFRKEGPTFSNAFQQGYAHVCTLYLIP